VESSLGADYLPSPHMCVRHKKKNAGLNKFRAQRPGTVSTTSEHSQERADPTRNWHLPF